MERLLVIPAAGLGTRLGAGIPKLLVPVNGRPMLDILRDLYAGAAGRTAVIVHPSAEARVRAHLGTGADVFVQAQPTGMLDAILLAAPAVARHRPRRVLVTWCDQVAIRPATIRRLLAAVAAPADPPLALLTCVRPEPYIHFERDSSGRIVHVLHRREGDVMPAVGESDAGVFDLSRDAYERMLPQYARAVDTGAGTGERNFLPFVAWMAARVPVVTVPCTDLEETVGVNTPDELARVERYLNGRAATDA
jgi:bifunctional UDP-N-acetylglucosamine pyrophosphorylase/glucosamine-1-phosphate N-acetyltransferase